MLDGTGLRDRQVQRWSRRRASRDLDGDPVTGGAYEADRDLSDVVMVAITIQPPLDTEGAPVHGEDGFGGDAPPHIPAGALGDFTGGLSSAAGPTLGNSFTDAAGVYLLDHGHVHFPGAELPAGWAYETWTIIDGVPSSRGRFGGAEGGEGHDEHDHDTPAPEAGKVAALQHLVPSTDLHGGALLITIEPAPTIRRCPTRCACWRRSCRPTRRTAPNTSLRTRGAPASPTGLRQSSSA